MIYSTPLNPVQHVSSTTFNAFPWFRGAVQGQLTTASARVYSQTNINCPVLREVAEIKNVGQVALEAGDSPDIIFQHDRELVAGEVAKEWFGITPAVLTAEEKQLKEEGAKLRATKAETEKPKGAKKRERKKARAETAAETQPRAAVA